jgi:hypothetical protein
VLISASPQNPEFKEVVKGFCSNHKQNAVSEMKNFPLDKELEEM